MTKQQEKREKLKPSRPTEFRDYLWAKIKQLWPDLGSQQIPSLMRYLKRHGVTCSKQNMYKWLHKSTPTQPNHQTAMDIRRILDVATSNSAPVLCDDIHLAPQELDEFTSWLLSSQKKPTLDEVRRFLAYLQSKKSTKE